MKRPGTAGFSLLEMMISLVVLSVIMGAAISVLRSQSQSFLRGGARMDLNQNARFALTTVDRVLRTVGTGTTSDQPMLVYADTNTVVFNANYGSDTTDGSAVYLNSDLPAGAINSVTTGTPITIPGTVINYPPQNYAWPGGAASRAETISFTFRDDSSTPDPTDFVLLQRVNAEPSEMVARNLRAYPGRNFFEYWFDSTGTGGATYSRQLPGTRLPVRHSAALHGGSGDIGQSALADSVRLVRVSFLAASGMLSTDTASRAFSTMVQLQNNGLLRPTACGGPPQNAESFRVISPDPTAASPDAGQVRALWNPSPDERTGARDVSGYNLYVRTASDTAWTFWTTQSAGLNNYAVSGRFIPGLVYTFGIAAQDCAPQESATKLTYTVTAAP